jgi:26S proteasome non-ATPase regulatory subunit 10
MSLLCEGFKKTMTHHCVRLFPWFVFVILKMADSVDEDGRTQLHHAAVAGSADLVLALLESGARVSTADEAQWSPLHSAASAGHVNVCDLLLHARADVNARNESKSTPLHYALSKGHGAVAVRLLESGADPASVDVSGSTPLHRACSAGRVDAVRTVCDVLRIGALNAVDRLGNTPLHNAALESNEGICAALIDAGADINIRNHDGHTPLHGCPADVCQRLLARIESQ